VRVVREAEGGIVRRVMLLDDTGGEVEADTRFLSHLSDANYSPNTICAYAYDLRHLACSSPSGRWAGTTFVRRPRSSSSAICAGCRRVVGRSGSV